MIEINNKTRSNIKIKKVKEVSEQFLKAYKKENFNVSIAFVGDKIIKKLNKDYRKKDRVTDVLAFREETPLKNKYLGEIVVNYAQIKRQAKMYKNSEQKELMYILIHGFLHIMGYNDKTEKDRKEMEKLGNEFIKKNKNSLVT